MGFYMDLTFGEKIRIILNRKNKSIDDLDGSLGMSRQNLWQQLNRDNYKERKKRRRRRVRRDPRKPATINIKMVV